MQRRASQLGAALLATTIISALTPLSANADTFAPSTWFTSNAPITQFYGCTSFNVEQLAAPAHSCPNSARYWHSGVDIGLKCGTPIYAPVRVTVISIGKGGTATSGTGPYYPQLQLADGTTVVLGHAQRPVVVHVGEVVPAGALVAYSGGGAGTGASNGCHLHFEVHPPGGGGFGSGTDVNPMSTLAITSSTNSSSLIVVRSGTNLLARSGAQGPWVLETSWLSPTSQIFCAGNILGYIGPKGTLWLKRGLYGSWIDESDAADAAVLTSSGRVLVRSGSTLLAKNSLSAPWVSEATWLLPTTKIYAAGNLIGYLGAKGTLWVKQGLGGNWIDESDTASDVLITASGEIVVRSNNLLLAKATATSPWVSEANWLSSSSTLYGAGDLLGFIGPQGYLWVKQGVSGAWHNESFANDVVFTPGGSMVVRSGTSLKIKESLSSSWVTEYRWLTPNATIFGSDDLFGYVGASGVMWAKSTIGGLWMYQTGLVGAVALQ